MFARFGVSEDLLRAAKVERVTDEEARSEYGITGPASSDMAGLIFEYYIPACDYRVTSRLRRDKPERDKEGNPKNKYMSPYGDGRHLYFPPGAKALLDDSETVIVLVESEKAALALMAWGKRMGIKLLALGLGG